LKSPLNPFKANESIRSKHRHGRRSKESKHYQESDILESPSVYCRSNLGDKISDYEDLWTQENNNSRSNLHVDAAASTSNHELISPMVISSPLTQLTPTSLVGSDVTITTNSPMQPPSKASTPFESKRSPFYSDPVDAVPTFPQIVRREPKVNLLPSFHRYSEPPKGQFEDLNFHMSPIEEKSFQSHLAAGSLDHLKQPPYKPVNSHRLDPTWTVDSSWEFVDKNDDSSENGSLKNGSSNMKPAATMSHQQKFRGSSHQQKIAAATSNNNTIDRATCAMSIDSYLMNSKSLNVYKLVAKKYPDLSSKPTTTNNNNNNIPSTWQTFESDGSSKFQRLSSYDNVEQQSVYGGSFHNSEPSEDGTMFSEPWDSSQWDTFLPTTDGNYNVPSGFAS